MKKFLKAYYWSVILFFVGGLIVSTIAYNVMGRAIGFENLSLFSLIPGFCIGAISGSVISFLVIRNRNMLLKQIAVEQKISKDLKAEIDRREKLEAELLIAKDKAEVANRTKSAFLANMSHELRTPLNAIIGFSDTMISETFGPLKNVRYHEYLDDINKSGLHLLNVINDILDISKIEVGESTVTDKSIDVSEIIHSSVQLVKQKVAERKLTLTIEVGKEPVNLRADEQKLKQIVINLLSNSIKFTPEGGKITIQCGEHPFGYEIRVVDNGIGIAPDKIETALTPFQQIDGALARKYEGTGLGLPLCNSLTELHGGQFELRSELGKGTTASIQLPKERLLENPVLNDLKNCANG